VPAKKPAKAPKVKPAKGPSLADLIVEALQAAGKPMSVVDLVSAVEDKGYESKNTAQLIRMAAGRGGRLKKMEGDVVGMG
jgi:hypothetical protein